MELEEVHVARSPCASLDASAQVLNTDEASDAAWLRSRTSRLLDSVNDDDILMSKVIRSLGRGHLPVPDLLPLLSSALPVPPPLPPSPLQCQHSALPPKLLTASSPSVLLFCLLANDSLLVRPSLGL